MYSTTGRTAGNRQVCEGKPPGRPLRAERCLLLPPAPALLRDDARALLTPVGEDGVLLLLLGCEGGRLWLPPPPYSGLGLRRGMGPVGSRHWLPSSSALSCAARSRDIHRLPSYLCAWILNLFLG